MFSTKLIKLALPVLITMILAIILWNPVPEIPPDEESIVGDMYKESVRLLFYNVTVEVEKIRGLDVPPGTEIRVVPNKWVLEQWEYTASELKDEELFYKALLLIPEELNYTEMRNRQIGSYLAFAWKGDVYVVKEHFNPDKPGMGEALSHEMEHIFQGYYFPEHSPDTFDEEMAYSALIEGDAILLGELYARTFNFSYEPAPVPIREVLDSIFYFPYDYGKPFVTFLYLEGGWEYINMALNDPPESTEQVIHPEKYLNKELFITLSMDIIPPNQWKEIREDRLGEFFIITFLSAHINRPIAYTAAEGWNGDLFIMYSNTTDFLFIWKIAWDTEKDGIEFVQSVTTMMDNIGKKDRNVWMVDGKYYKLIENDNYTTIFAGSSKRDVLQNMISTVK
jgi:hypothetical protein